NVRSTGAVDRDSCGRMVYECVACWVQRFVHLWEPLRSKTSALSARFSSADLSSHRAHFVSSNLKRRALRSVRETRSLLRFRRTPFSKDVTALAKKIGTMRVKVLSNSVGGRSMIAKIAKKS